MAIRGPAIVTILVALTAMIACAQTARLANRAEPLPGITTSGQPDASALRMIADEGYRTVIDLRRPDEDRGIDERAVVEGLGMSYVSLPIDGADGVTYGNAQALDALLAGIDDPVLIHCATGNRAGAMLALRARLNGAGRAEALALGIAAGLEAPALRETVESRLEAPP